MTMFELAARPNAGESNGHRTWLLGPPAGLAALLLAAFVLAFLPAARVSSLKGIAARWLAPGQIRFARAREWTLRPLALLAAARATAQEQALVAEELGRLRARNNELEAALALVRLEEGEAPPDAAPLVVAGLVRARVLGRQARAFLARADIIGVGGDDGLAAGDLALAITHPLVDQGTQAALAVDDWALAGRRVWGRLDEVGSQTASVRRVTDPGFRDVVEVAHCDDARRRAAARGVLEGTGEPLARVRMVATTEPVSAGDYVLATCVRGAVSAPLIYGRIVRVERAAGKTHWDIWMQPAVGPDEPAVVSILRLALNPERKDEGGRRTDEGRKEGRRGDAETRGRGDAENVSRRLLSPLPSPRPPSVPCPEP